MNSETDLWGSPWYRASFAYFTVAASLMAILALCILTSVLAGWKSFELPTAVVFTGLTLIVSVLLTCIGSMCGVVALSIREDRAPAIVPTLCNLMFGAAIVGIVVVGGLA